MEFGTLDLSGHVTEEDCPGYLVKGIELEQKLVDLFSDYPLPMVVRACQMVFARLGRPIRSKTFRGFSRAIGMDWAKTLEKQRQEFIAHYRNQPISHRPIIQEAKPENRDPSSGSDPR